jgi:hypothetical protein
MKRATLLQELIIKYNYQRYLEIGIHKGKTFLPLVCKHKIAIDPAFRISPLFLLKWIFKYPQNLTNKYFLMTSDEFFKRKTENLQDKARQQLIFIDGLHTFEASLNDVINSLNVLDPKGIIVLHDCMPPHSAAATPAKSLKGAVKTEIPGWTGAWCGDVWKCIAYLKEKHAKELDVFVLDTDLGLGIIKLKVNQFPFTKIDQNCFDRIDSKDFDFLLKDPEGLIGLKDKSYFHTFLKNS